MKNLFPDYTKSILAFRSWKLDEEYYLKGQNMPWGIGINKALCTKYNAKEKSGRQINLSRNIGHPHEAPSELCPSPGCGFYGVFNISEVNDDNNIHLIFGLAAFWGKVILGEKGLRARYAKVHTIIKAAEGNPLTEYYNQRARNVANLYGISIKDIEEIIPEFEANLPSEVKIIDKEKELEDRQFGEYHEKFSTFDYKATNTTNTATNDTLKTSWTAGWRNRRFW